jgi:hypothetical protein
MLLGADDIIHADRCITSRQMAVQLLVINGNATDSARQFPSSEPKRQSPNLVGLCSTIPPPPPYSPDVAPSDFHLFGVLKGTLRGTRCEDDENVIRPVRTWLREQEMSW